MNAMLTNRLLGARYRDLFSLDLPVTPELRRLLMRMLRAEAVRLPVAHRTSS